MKKILLTAAIAALICSCGSKNSYTITGNVENLLSETVYLMNDDAEIIDSAAVVNNKFSLKGIAEEPSMGLIMDGEEPFVMFIIENGKIRIAGNADDPSGISVTGTAANDAYFAFNNKRNALTELFMAEETTDEQREAIIKEDEANMVEGVESNLDNFFGLMMLNEILTSVTTDEAFAYLDKFPGELQETKLGLDIRKKIEGIKRTEIGNRYTDITLVDKDGKEIILSSIVGPGKYVLIDFWASWCPPCMEEVPYLVSAYEKYGNQGFEIFGISSDRNEEDWLNAIKDKNMTWINVIAPKNTVNQAAIDYSVFTIPANFLISPEGTIIAKNLRGHELEEKLKELLGK